MTWAWTLLAGAAFLFAAVHGRGAAAAAALTEGARSAVELALGMLGTVMFWSGLMEVMDRAGVSDALGKLLRPALERLFPSCREDGELRRDLSCNVTANMLGLGNAATPLGLEAARRMSKKTPGVAGDSLCMLVVCNTASIQLIPTTVAAVRLAAGCTAPFDILPAVWATSLCSVTVGILAAKTMARLWRRFG